MRNYGQIRKLVACTVEVAVASLLTFLLLYLHSKRSLRISPGVCADFDFNLLYLYFSVSQDFFHSRTSCC